MEEQQNKLLFWSDDPNILFNTSYITEFFPTPNMSFEQKLNAVSRGIIVLSLFLFFISKNIRFILVGFITLGVIWFIYYKQTLETNNENFSTFSANKNIEIPDNLFSQTQEHNPLQNVLLNDYENPSQKKPAPPSYTDHTKNEVLDQTKKLIDSMNPEQPKISTKLFKSLEDNLAFEQSMRPFYSNPSTTIPNDQNAFAEFCYGSMVSCKEGNQLACTRNLPRHNM